MDFDALKEQWNDIEERDGIRLSWNTFPSSRMVRVDQDICLQFLTINRKHRVSLYQLQHFIHL
jgi:hypothetical protein